MNFRHKLILSLVFALPVATLAPAFAQEPNPSAAPVQQQAEAMPSVPEAPAPAAEQPAPPARPTRAGWHRFDEPDQVEHPNLPLTLTLQPGTWINVRIDQEIHSDHNRPGEAWTAVLTQPIIVNGRVVAQRGQTVGGVISEAERAGRAKGVSRLGLELNELTLADGRQLAAKCRLMEFRGPTSWGRDAVGIGTTVGTGAVIGAAVNGPVGAGVGAAAGVVASTVGVLLTRGKPTVIYPETTLTFRLEAPLTFTIDNPSSLRAFAPVRPDDYKPAAGTLRTRAAAPPYAPGQASIWAPYPYYYDPFLWGPRVTLWYGGGGYGRGWYGGGWYGGGGRGHGGHR